MRYSIQHIATIIGGAFVNEAPHTAMIEHILLDSRQVTFPASSVFIALNGRRHDGHEFIIDLYKSGIRNFIVSKEPISALLRRDGKKVSNDDSIFPDANFIKVNSTLEAFHALAKWHRHQFSLPIIGITGSSGKTIVKEWLYQLMHPEYHIVRSPKRYNSQTGAPLSVLQINPEHRLGIFEAGISQMGEMEKLGPIIDPDMGIFTNIGEAHSEGFPDIQTKLKEKLSLFKNVKTLIYRVDDSRVEQAILELIANNTDKEPATFTWSAIGKMADLKVEYFSNSNIGKNENTLLVSSSKSNKEPKGLQFSIPFSDAASIENAMHCCALMLHLGYEPEIIADRMAKLEAVGMRLELKEGINGCTIINDSYNSDFTSLTIALNFLEQQCMPGGKREKKRTLILSDILQSGLHHEDLYRAVAKLLSEKGIERFIGIGHEVAVLKRLLPANADTAFFKTTSSLLEDFQNLGFRDETILLKGTRRFEFEKIANRLAAKIHQTTLEVNLSAILHNLRLYQSKLRPGTRLMVMVKASAYGSGSAEVAKLLEFQHVDYLGVAFADEGVELRKAGVQLPILVMIPEEATFEALIRFRLEPEIYSLSLLEKFISFIQEHPALPEDYTPSIHLKLETGMHRLGFEQNNLEQVIQCIKGDRDSSHPSDKPVLKVNSIFSHLAASEAPEHDEFTRQQVALFSTMFEYLSQGLGYKPIRHILNSSGILRFPEFQMDMVRLGIGLYGIDSSDQLANKLQTVNTLKATISQIKNIRKNETIGYGRCGIAEQPMKIATLSIGYADGLLRQAGNGRYSVLIHGKKAKLTGNVCMDMVMADISNIPEAKEGDTVIVFGKSESGDVLPVEELAACLGTIPYEIFTTISNRVKRVYIQE